VNSSSDRRSVSDRPIHGEVVPCSLGLVTIAATDQGVCWIAFGDSERESRLQLRLRFPQATDAAPPRWAAWVAAVVSLVDAPSGPLPVPLDIHGTAFQCRVWELLAQIPAGTTTSYAEIARRLDQPAACRAVAAACAANRLAVAIPCHRVVRSDGALGGYRWGVERKQTLLAREASAATSRRA
jgi:AraC family transcriptional regulator of adaptative response/methylated-DNA-[protein]-cysteine methyltransferase